MSLYASLCTQGNVWPDPGTWDQAGTVQVPETDPGGNMGHWSLILVDGGNAGPQDLILVCGPIWLRDRPHATQLVRGTKKLSATGSHCHQGSVPQNI